MKQVTLYEFPHSIPCQDCLNSLSVMDNQGAAEGIPRVEMASLCFINCQSNDGVNCKKKISIKTEEEE